ncbi:hypothetical protein ZHAS_00007775 [Anopheles sinensis]|uniref:Uncharacterized protein n=1 Tax=Anopheles sinensis TaxID=74873 RepID=A0A084VQP6_ANOSI|nr:hypothetical protein ZHAS_00007775 [Anopheles sinensis]
MSWKRRSPKDSLPLAPCWAGGLLSSLNVRICRLPVTDLPQSLAHRIGINPNPCRKSSIGGAVCHVGAPGADGPGQKLDTNHRKSRSPTRGIHSVSPHPKGFTAAVKKTHPLVSSKSYHQENLL